MPLLDGAFPTNTNTHIFSSHLWRAFFSSIYYTKLQSKFRTVPVNKTDERLFWFQIEVCEIVFFPSPLPPRPHWMKYCSESVLRRTDQGAIYSYIQPYKSKYTCIWLYTGPTLCQTCAGLARELYMAIFIHTQVNIALYGYRQDLPDTLSVLRRTDQGAIQSYIHPYTRFTTQNGIPKTS